MLAAAAKTLTSRAIIAICLLIWFTTGLAASSEKPGLVIMAHGGEADWNAAVIEAVKPLSQHCPVEIAFGMADRNSLQSAIKRLEDRGVDRIAVVRLFVSGESFLHQTEYFLGLRPNPPPFFLLHGHAGVMGADPHHMPPPRFVSSRQHPIPPVQRQALLSINREGLYDSDAIGGIMAERVKGLSEQPENEAVLVLAHGEGDDRLNQRWRQRVTKLTDSIRDLGNFAAIQVETLREDWREKRQRAEARIRDWVQTQNQAGRRVLVVPFRVFGFGPYREVLEGLEYVADEQGLLPHPEVTRWLADQASRCFSENGWVNPFEEVGLGPPPSAH